MVSHVKVCSKKWTHVNPHALNMFTLDINECDAGTHACDHFCHNIIGSYTCSCESGFELIEMKVCVGM